MAHNSEVFLLQDYVSCFRCWFENPHCLLNDWIIVVLSPCDRMQEEAEMPGGYSSSAGIHPSLRARLFVCNNSFVPSQGGTFWKQKIATSAAQCRREVRQWKAKERRLRRSYDWQTASFCTKDTWEDVLEIIILSERGNKVKMVTQLRVRQRRFAQLHRSVEQWLAGIQ